MEFIEFMAKNSSLTIGVVVAIIGSCLTVLGLCYQVWSFTITQNKQNNLKNEQSYYQPLALDFGFSEETLDIPNLTDRLTVRDIPKLKLEFYQGFPVGNKSFYASNEKDIIFYTEVDHDFEKLLAKQKKNSSSEITLTVAPAFPITDESDSLLYSTTFHLITDFLQNKQLFMVMYVMNKPTGSDQETSVIGGLVFDKDYTLLKDTTEFTFLKDSIPLGEKEEAEAGKVVTKYLPVYADLVKKINDL
ncbi:hypothetical protein [Candidatus Enterococcus ikei]|uniref:Uncharacterized protein n=1 Tax=Candidatus Enterococcus ikei TaxID=2815326 RepID=A0ABS3H0A3_9ENTE|nr:hypothetical protein [Enterococcus sp. DIV0869a]MBO0440525.1 hypothetical protein [Enterococcus sp. DIV0869a]